MFALHGLRLLHHVAEIAQRTVLSSPRGRYLDLFGISSIRGGRDLRDGRCPAATRCAEAVLQCAHRRIGLVQALSRAPARVRAQRCAHRRHRGRVASALLGQLRVLQLACVSPTVSCQRGGQLVLDRRACADGLIAHIEQQVAPAAPSSAEPARNAKPAAAPAPAELQSAPACARSMLGQFARCVTAAATCVAGGLARRGSSRCRHRKQKTTVTAPALPPRALSQHCSGRRDSMATANARRHLPGRPPCAALAVRRRAGTRACAAASFRKSGYAGSGASAADRDGPRIAV